MLERSSRIAGTEVSMRRIVPWVVLAASATLVGWMNFHAGDDVQPVAAALLVAGFAFGAYRPRRAWLYVLLLFAAVPLSGAYADAVNYHLGQVKPAPLYESIIALAFPVVGAALGAGLRLVLGRTAQAGA
jgi:hypothetical protein